MNITGFGRASIEVRDIHASERFYTDVLRMTPAPDAGRESEIGFRVGKSHRFVVKAAAAARATAAEALSHVAPSDLGTHHLAFVVGNNPRALEAAAAHLTEQGIAFEQVEHEEYASIYLRDPDGRLIELYYWPEW